MSLGDFAVGAEAEDKNRPRLAAFNSLVREVLRVRMVGSATADLAWVADGKLDGCVIFGSHDWDLAAGLVIARAAGAQVSSVDGLAIVAASPIFEGLRE